MRTVNVETHAHNDGCIAQRWPGTKHTNLTNVSALFKYDSQLCVHYLTLSFEGYILLLLRK